MTSQQTERIYEFGPFRVNAVKRLLLRDGVPVLITSKVFDTLLVLVEHSGEVLQKDQLMKALWPDTSVEENNLTQHISMLRKALGECAADHCYVMTVPGWGYKFAASVNAVSEALGDGSDLMQAQRIQSLITVDVENKHDGKQEKPWQEKRKYLSAALSLSLSRPWRLTHSVLGVFGLLICLTVVLSYWLTASTAKRQETSAPARSIAVLPFKSLNTQGDDLLGSGMADTLIAKLSDIHQITVRPTSAVIRYAGQNQDALAAGRELNVDSVLEGTVQRSGNRVRVTVQLVNVRSKTSLWAQSFDKPMTDIFAIQDSISEQVTKAMLLSLNGEGQKRLRKRDTENVDAYQAYLRGRHFWNKRSAEGLKKGIDYFQQAIELDPTYAVAYAGLGDAYCMLGYYNLGGLPPSESFQRAKTAAMKALAIDDSLAEAHTSLALIRTSYDKDNSGAEWEYKRAIELNPNYPTAHHWYSHFLTLNGRPQEAMAEIERAQELDPLSPIINTTLAEHLYYSRRYDEAIAQLIKTLEIDGNFSHARFLLGLAYEQKGLYEEAISELQKALEMDGTKGVVAAALGHSYARAGKKEEARRVLNELLRTQSARPYDIATIYVGLGEKQQALKWLQRTLRENDRWLLRTDPRLDGLRSDPNFRDLNRG